MIAGVIASSYITIDTEVVHTLTIPSGTVASSLTDFVTRVDLSAMSDDWWTATASDLGNVRVKSSGTVIPFDVVEYDRTAKTGELFFKASLTTGDNVFTIETVNSATALDPTDTNGRNNVWSDYEVATIPGASAINRRTGTALTVTGTAPIIGPTSKSATITGHDGITNDGTYWYSNGDDYIRKYDSTFTQVASNLSPDTGTGETLTTMSDTCVVGGELFGFMAGTSAQMLVVWDTADLSYKRSYDISSTGWAPAGVCYNADDGYLYSVGYSAGTDVDILIQKWDTTGNLIGTITTSSLTSKQAIEIWDGFFWISRSTSVYRVNLDGSGAVAATSGVYDRAIPQGLTVHDDHLYVLNTDGTPGSAEVYRLEYPSAEHYHFQANYLRATSLTKFTDWTYGCTTYLAKANTAGRTMLTYGSNDSSDSNRETLTTSSVSHVYTVANSTDGGLVDPVAVPTSQDRYRWNSTHQGTTQRTLYRDGALKATDVGCAARPGGTSGSLALFIGTDDTSNTTPMFGSITRAYLRNGVLSADWLAAECESWETPSSFYTIT